MPASLTVESQGTINAVPAHQPAARPDLVKQQPKEGTLSAPPPCECVVLSLFRVMLSVEPWIAILDA